METSDKNRDNELELVRVFTKSYSIIIIIMSWFLPVLIELIHGNLFCLFLILLIIAVVWKVISMPVFQKKKLCFKKC